MTIRIMLVDDSAIVRGLIANALANEDGIEIVASVSNGQMALEALPRFKPHLVILDIEMPVMDGLTALPKLLELDRNLVVIIASTLSTRNATISLQALELGAKDYVAKPTARDKDNLEQFYRELKEKIQALGSRAMQRSATVEKPGIPHANVSAKPAMQVGVQAMAAPMLTQSIRALAVASSTGGPQALQTLFGGLKGRVRSIPIFITQHMPPTFTTILAEHISSTWGAPCREGVDGETVQPGKAYLAPGNYHMVVEKNEAKLTVRLNQNPPVNFCRPSADPMIESLINIYGNGLLLVVLTGMGSDGAVGAKKLVDAGGAVIAQDEASCVVWGMPRAVTEQNLCKAVLPLDQIASYLGRVIRD